MRRCKKGERGGRANGNTPPCESLYSRFPLCVRACVQRSRAVGSALGVVWSPVLLPAPLHTAPPPPLPPVRGVCRNELKQTLVKQSNKKNTHTMSATCQRRFLTKKKEPTIVLQPLPFTTIRRYYLCHDRVGEGGGVRRVRQIIRRIRFGMVCEHFVLRRGTQGGVLLWGVGSRRWGNGERISSSSTAGYTSQQICINPQSIFSRNTRVGDVEAQQFHSRPSIRYTISNSLFLGSRLNAIATQAASEGYG